MGSRNILDESEFGNEWMLGNEDKVRGVKGDSQVSHNKSLSLQRQHFRKPNVIKDYAHLAVETNDCCSLLPHSLSYTKILLYRERSEPWNLFLLSQSFLKTCKTRCAS